MKFFLPAFLCLLAVFVASAAADVKPAPVAGKGVKPEGPATPEMLVAMSRMSAAGRYEGARGSLTFFRWSNGEPKHLAHLGLWGPQIDNELLALSATMPDLEFVSLYETSVDDAGLRAVASLPKLRHLAILPIERYEKAGFGPPQWSYPFMKPVAARPRIGGAGLRALAEAATLEGLDLRDAEIVAADLAGLAAWPKLSSLGLPNRIDEETVRHLQACRRLGHLKLGDRRIGAGELECIAAWKSLRRLTLTHADLDAEALRALSKLETVETVELNACGLTDEDLRHLAGSPKLMSLSLSRNEIDGPGLVHLASLVIPTLELDFNNLRDATLPHLTTLRHVEKLNLAYNTGLTDQGIRGGILQSMGHLKEINLRGVKAITDASIDDLVKLGHLKHLGIREMGVSPAGVERIKAAMPGTQVFR